MTDRTPTPPFEDEIRRAVAAPEAAPHFVTRLHAQLIEQASSVSATPARRSTSRMVWAVAIVLGFALIGILLIGPQQVATAMQTLLGYLPGVGIVDRDSAVQILAEPASSSKDGITITVKQVVADPTRTQVEYKVSGIPAPAAGYASPICTEAPALQLPDGNTLTRAGGRGFGMESLSGSLMSFETRATFPPIAPEVHKLIFLSPCQMPSIELALIPAPEDFIVPAVEVNSNSETSSAELSGSLTSEPPAGTPPSEPLSTDALIAPTPGPGVSGLYLDRVVELEDAYLLSGKFTAGDDLPGSLELSGDFQYKIHIIDENGNPVSSRQRPDILPDVRMAGVYYWAYEISNTIAGPVTLRLDFVRINTTHTSKFQLDAGSEPQPGQEWQLDLPLKMGSYEFVIDRVKRLENGYRLILHSGSDVPERTGFSVSMPGIPASTRESPLKRSIRKEDQVIFTEDFLVEGEVPRGTLTFELAMDQTVPLPGPWSLTWSPPR